MSGIYIKGMSMPTGAGVIVIYKRSGKFYAGNDMCPIEPVPDHGRLGDLDALEKVFREDAREEWNKWARPLNWADAFDDVADIVGEEPTIIPADGG